MYYINILRERERANFHINRSISFGQLKFDYKSKISTVYDDGIQVEPNRIRLMKTEIRSHQADIRSVKTEFRSGLIDGIRS